jgi:hypothetical protein
MNNNALLIAGLRILRGPLDTVVQDESKLSVSTKNQTVSLGNITVKMDDVQNKEYGKLHTEAQRLESLGGNGMYFAEGILRYSEGCIPHTIEWYAAVLD